MELGRSTITRSLVPTSPGRASVARGAAVAQADPYERATFLMVHGLVLLIGLDLRTRYGASLTLPAAILLLPMWAPSLRRYRLAALIAALGVMAPVSGVLLAERSSFDHEVSSLIQTDSIALLLSGLAGFVLLLWAREVLPLHRIVVLYAAGAFVSDVMAARLSWKFDLSLPLTLLVLGLVERGGIRWRAAGIVMVFGVLGLLDDSRSFVAFCALAAALTVWQRRPRTTAPSRWYPATVIATLSVAVYLLVQALLTGGYLGSEVQERSVVQTESSGSILAGGRPEWAATRELVALNPIGYGVGVVPNWNDLQAGKKGLSSINVELESNRQRYMFGEVFNLHSVASDLWAGYGLVGVGLAVVMCVALVRSLSFALAARAAPTSGILLALLALWFMFFGPIYSNWLHVCVTLGLVLVTVDEPGDDGSLPPPAGYDATARSSF